MHATTAQGPGRASALLRWQFSLAHRLLDGTFAGVPAELIHQQPAETAAPLGASYAQIVVSEDLIVNGVLAAGQPLARSIWAGQTGLSDLPPLVEPISRPIAAQATWLAWSRRVRLDPAAFRPYSRAV